MEGRRNQPGLTDEFVAVWVRARRRRLGRRARVAPSATSRVTSAAGSAQRARSVAGSSPSWGRRVARPTTPSCRRRGDCTAVSSSWSQTSGQPSASRQKRPTSRCPSHATSPRRPQPARNMFPGSITQKAFPPGSARTTWLLFRELPDVEMVGAQPQRRVDDALLVLEGRAGQMEVQPGCSGLRSEAAATNRSPTCVSSPGNNAALASSTISGRACPPRTPPGRPGRGSRSSPPPVARACPHAMARARLHHVDRHGERSVPASTRTR